MAFILVVAGCSGSSDRAAIADDITSQDDAATCAASASRVIDRFDQFLEPFADLSPDEFFAAPELEGLDTFQNDVATIIVESTTDPNVNCSASDFEGHVDAALEGYAGDGLLNQYLVGTIRSGIEIERRDIVVDPEDDLVQILPLLGPGSSVTFTEGEFELAATLLVQSELTLVGAGDGMTTIVSTADAAAVAVLGAGELVVRDLAIRHSGTLPASVMIGFDAPLSLTNVTLSGGVTNAEGGGGTGLVLSGENGVDGAAPPSAEIDVVIVNSGFVDNEAAGLAVTAAFAPTIVDSRVERNAQCGACFFDTSAGAVQRTIFTGNGIGLQAGGTSSPELVENSFVDNEVVGVLIEDSATAKVLDSSFAGEAVVGVDVQGASAPIILRNTFGPHAVAMSLRGETLAVVGDNAVEGGEVGLLVGGTAAPTVTGNSFVGTAVAGILSSEQSLGMFQNNTIESADGAGAVSEGSAEPSFLANTFTGGLVGLVFREDSAGSARENTFTMHQVGIEAADRAAPVLERNTFDAISSAGVILGGDGSATLNNNRFTNSGDIAIQLGGTGEHLVGENQLTGGETGILITEASQAKVEGNTLTDQAFGIGVSGQAAPVITDNEIRNSASGALSFEGESEGSVLTNTIVDAGVVGIRVAGNAAPTIEANTIFARIPGNQESSGQDPDEPDSQDPDSGDSAAASGAGLLYAESSGGIARLNQLFGFVISVQVSDQASPELLTNRADGAGVGGVGILYSGSSSGRAEGNVAANQELGFQLSGTASPELVDNSVEGVGTAAFLIQGEAAARLSGNTCETNKPGIVLLEQAAPDIGTNNCAVVQQ